MGAADLMWVASLSTLAPQLNQIKPKAEGQQVEKTLSETSSAKVLLGVVERSTKTGIADISGIPGDEIKTNWER